MLNDKIDPIISNGVSTICGKDIIPKGFVTVSWYQTDYEGQLHTQNCITCSNLQTNVYYEV